MKIGRRTVRRHVIFDRLKTLLDNIGRSLIEKDRVDPECPANQNGKRRTHRKRLFQTPVMLRLQTQPAALFSDRLRDRVPFERHHFACRLFFLRFHISIPSHRFAFCSV